MEALYGTLFSDGLPFHPAIVHVPLVLAALMPLVLIWLIYRAYRGDATRRAWAVALALQCAVTAGGLVALSSGHDEEERVEARVPDWSVEIHERRATTFLVCAGALLVVVAAATAAPRASRFLAPLALALGLAVTALAVATGHAGGLLVYRHGAATAPGP